jgi:hypothetical protein
MIPSAASQAAESSSSRREALEEKIVKDIFWLRPGENDCGGKPLAPCSVDLYILLPRPLGQQMNARYLTLLREAAHIARLEQPVTERAGRCADGLPRGLVGAGHDFRFLTRGGLQVAQVGEVRQQGLEALKHGGTAKSIASENREVSGLSLSRQRSNSKLNTR